MCRQTNDLQPFSHFQPGYCAPQSDVEIGQSDAWRPRRHLDAEAHWAGVAFAHDPRTLVPDSKFSTSTGQELGHAEEARDGGGVS